MKRALIIFTRAPIPGQTKTRMTGPLTPAGCARLHTCFLQDIYAQCRKTGAAVFLCYTPKGKEQLLYPIFGKSNPFLLQSGEDLGERMYRAVHHVLAEGYEACLLLGTDVPELQAADLNRAFSVLERHDIVLGPTEDGGYYLVGMKRPQKAVFQVEGYGKDTVLSDTVRQSLKAGLTVGFTKRLPDMDTYEDLLGCRRRIRKADYLQRSATGRYLARNSRISVIIPIFNEEKTVDRLQRQLERLKDHCEILFVDGGSTDKTVEKIRPYFKVITTGKGRARQMNAGAMESSGDVLFFLHCDSQLPRRPLEEIRRVMKNHSAGCFGIAFHSRNFFLFTCRIISNRRVQDRQVMFGDQGIFVDRCLFFEAGMFPQLPIMEDYQFSLTLREMGVTLGMARHRIYTSDRRFPRGTLPKLQLMWKMNRLRKMYREQAPIEQIHELYRDVR